MSEAERPAPSPHAQKFRTATALLIGLAIGAIAVAVVIATSSTSTGPTQPWSAWRPPDNGIQGAQEIADHIAPFYRISGIDQLDVVTVVNLGNPNNVNPTTGVPQGLQVAVKPAATSSAVSLLGGNTVAYNLCGINSSNCSIGVGKPSALRLLLLRREALELALYTFKYISNTQNVVAILPPGYTETGCTSGSLCSTPHAKPTIHPETIALLFVDQELQPWLNQPLIDTFPEEFPPSVPELPLWAQTSEAGLVEQITARGMFSEQLVSAQDGTHLIELSPQPPS
jgi:hypothetical protein